MFALAGPEKLQTVLLNNYCIEARRAFAVRAKCLVILMAIDDNDDATCPGLYRVDLISKVDLIREKHMLGCGSSHTIRYITPLSAIR